MLCCAFACLSTMMKKRGVSMRVKFGRLLPLEWTTRSKFEKFTRPATASFLLSFQRHWESTSRQWLEKVLSPARTLWKASIAGEQNPWSPREGRKKSCSNIHSLISLCFYALLSAFQVTVVHSPNVQHLGYRFLLSFSILVTLPGVCELDNIQDSRVLLVPLSSPLHNSLARLEGGDEEANRFSHLSHRSFLTFMSFI